MDHPEPPVPLRPPPAPGSPHPPGAPPPPAAAPRPPAGAGAGVGAGVEAATPAELAALRAEIGKVVVGQDGIVSGLLAALLVGGHVLLEGVPGVAKTLLVKTLATALDLRFSRVQFTPDLMPADLTGQLVLDPSGGLRFRPGPVFTNLLLADEINRTPPKTQSALLEAMEERQVSIDGEARLLPEPFLVVATQNPIEYEGTYPLPEAQLDRFLFKLSVDYPSEADEYELLQRHHRGLDPRHPAAAGVRTVLTPDRLAAARRAAAAVVVEPVVLQYVVALTRATRDTPATQLGASPRAMVALLAAAKAWAWLSGRSYVTPDEVKTVYKPALRHRVSVRPELAVEGVTTDTVLDRVLASVPSPR
ncbi:MAG: MoxR family ATPase [Acidimicrobiales bacterium]